MRLWSFHPKYLDAKGLVAVWREALLAQKVLKGETRGYRNHPQLIRFKAQTEPVFAIAAYLGHIAAEARHRKYQFDESRIAPDRLSSLIPCTRGQLLYEWEHFKNKLITRDPDRLRGLANITEPGPHPLFTIIPGEPESWENVKD